MLGILGWVHARLRMSSKREMGSGVFLSWRKIGFAWRSRRGVFRQAVFVLSPFVVAAVSDERIGSRRTKALAWLNWSLAESLKSGLAGCRTMTKRSGLRN